MLLVETDLLGCCEDYDKLSCKYHMSIHNLSYSKLMSKNVEWIFQNNAVS